MLKKKEKNLFRIYYETDEEKLTKDAPSWQHLFTDLMFIHLNEYTLIRVIKIGDFNNL